MPLNCFTKLPECQQDVSSDDEMNSCGEYEDESFCIESMSSEEEIVQPIECETKPKQDMIVCSKNIIDCCSYSDENLFLYKEGTIICQTRDEERQIHCNRHLKRLFVFDGELYGLTKSTLYVLSMNYYNTCYWVFSKVKWAPSSILYVNVTLDEKWIWIQTDQKCYLFDSHDKKIKYDCDYKRVYGVDQHTYLDFSISSQCHITINGKMVETVNDVISGVIDCHNQITFLYVDDQYLYKDIRIVNYKPYYIYL